MKKLSAKQIGNLSERMTHSVLEKQGFHVWSVPQNLSRWTKGKDIFNLFDHVAIAKENLVFATEPYSILIREGSIIFIQTKTTRVDKKVIKEIQEFCNETGVSAFMFVWTIDDLIIYYLQENQDVFHGNIKGLRSRMQSQEV